MIDPTSPPTVLSGGLSPHLRNRTSLVATPPVCVRRLAGPPSSITVVKQRRQVARRHSAWLSNRTIEGVTFRLVWPCAPGDDQRCRIAAGILNGILRLMLKRSAWNGEAGQHVRLKRCVAGRSYESYESWNSVWISHCGCPGFLLAVDGMDSGKSRVSSRHRLSSRSSVSVICDAAQRSSARLHRDFACHNDLFFPPYDASTDEAFT